MEIDKKELSVIKQIEKNKHLFFDNIFKSNNNIDLSGFNYKGNRVRGTCKCKKCHHEWQVTPEVLKKNPVCPKCRENEKAKEQKEKLLLKYYEKAHKMYQNKNISNIEFYYNEKGKIMAKFFCHNKYCDGTEHGVHEQNGYYFLSGHGCPNCATHQSRPYTTEEWVRMAKEKYPMYDYSKSEYKNKDTKVSIICKKHGEFDVIPKEFLYEGKCCPLCNKEKKQEEFIKKTIRKAKEKHKDKGYIYHPELINIEEGKMGIECNKHGIFWQNIKNHINSKTDCPLCAKEKQKISQRLTFDDVISKANKIHNFKYTYHRESYIDTQTKTIITCPIHGDFEQAMHEHLQGKGCKQCANERIRKAKALSLDNVLEKMKNAHKYKNYKYDLIEDFYENVKSKVPIICENKFKNGEKHGIFWQTVSNHIYGNGCPLCKTSYLENDVNIALREKINMEFIHQYHNKDILGRQSFDFFLPSVNIAIECQGEQHFINNFFKSKGIKFSERHLEYIQSLDKEKKRNCIKNGIKLIYFLDKKFVKYLDKEDYYATNVDDLIDLIKMLI